MPSTNHVIIRELVKDAHFQTSAIVSVEISDTHMVLSELYL